MSLHAELDHLVIGARSLEEGVAWCEATLGVTPGPGGRHALMSTHNRLFSIASPAFPRAYLEIIAIDPEAPDPGRARWFDLDDTAVQAALAQGPQLLHWVLRVRPIEQVLSFWRGLGQEAGAAVQASRATPRGELRWQIAVRPDGRRLQHGMLPLLIEWGDVHPTDGMADSGVLLRSFAVGETATAEARKALSLSEVPCNGPAHLTAELDTPKGLVSLSGRVNSTL